jgi:hypothetical protein
MWVFPVTAAAISGALAAALGRSWMQTRRPNLLAWCLALSLFAIASLAAGAGMLIGWTTALFRIYYLFGAVVNVPVLALGTIYLLAPRRVGHVCAVVVALGAVSAVFTVYSADLNVSTLHVSGIPSGRDVMPAGPRALSRYYSIAGSVVVVGGALWSAWRLARRRQGDLWRLARANVLIAVGTLVVAIGSIFARYGRGSVFAISLAVGALLMFRGFMTTRVPARR